jgi:hypothetical protein
MAKGEFIFGPHVEHSDRPGANSSQQFLATDGFHCVAIMKIAAHEPFDFGHVALSEPAQRRKQVENGVVDKAVIDEFAVSPCCHRAGAPRALEMLQGIGDRQTRFWANTSTLRSPRASFIEIECDSGCDADCREQGVSASVVTRSDASPALKFCEQALDFVARSIQRLVIKGRLSASCWWNAGFNASLSERRGTNCCRSLDPDQRLSFRQCWEHHARSFIIAHLAVHCRSKAKEAENRGLG